MITGRHKAAMTALEEDLARKDMEVIQLRVQLADAARELDEAVSAEMIKRINAEAALVRFQNPASEPAGQNRPRGGKEGG